MRFSSLRSVLGSATTWKKHLSIKNARRCPLSLKSRPEAHDEVASDDKCRANIEFDGLLE